MSILRFLLLPLAVVGCSNTADIQTDPAASDAGHPTTIVDSIAVQGAASGSRLKAKWLTAEDGARQFQGFHDSARGEDCSFLTATDGQRRCLPQGLSVNPNVFTDTACTKPLAYGAKGCAAIQTATFAGSYCAAGDTKYAVHSVGKRFTGASLYTKSGTGCSASSADGWSAHDLYVLGAEIDPSEFVAANLTTEE